MDILHNINTIVPLARLKAPLVAGWWKEENLVQVSIREEVLVTIFAMELSPLLKKNPQASMAIEREFHHEGSNTFWRRIFRGGIFNQFYKMMHCQKYILVASHSLWERGYHFLIMNWAQHSLCTPKRNWGSFRWNILSPPNSIVFLTIYDFSSLLCGWS